MRRWRYLFLWGGLLRGCTVKKERRLIKQTRRRKKQVIHYRTAQPCGSYTPGGRALAIPKTWAVIVRMIGIGVNLRLSRAAASTPLEIIMRWLHAFMFRMVCWDGRRSLPVPSIGSPRGLRANCKPQSFMQPCSAKFPARNAQMGALVPS